MSRKFVDKFDLKKSKNKSDRKGRVITHRGFTHEFLSIENNNAFKFRTLEVVAGSSFEKLGNDFNYSFVRIFYNPDDIDIAERCKKWLIENFVAYVKIIPHGLSSIVIQDYDIRGNESIREVVNELIDDSVSNVDKKELKKTAESFLTEVGL